MSLTTRYLAVEPQEELHAQPTSAWQEVEVDD